MCGIFAYLGKSISKNKLKNNFNTFKIRGPDNSHFISLSNQIFLGFHRLSINDLSKNGDQPLYHPEDSNIVVICNGEIYNYKQLIDKYNFNNYKSTSDCEVIVWMYKKFGIDKTVRELDGVFSFILVDLNTNDIFAARDPFGVRPMFIGYNSNDDDYLFASEVKGIAELCEFIEPFQPGTWWNNKSKKNTRYYNYNYEMNTISNTDTNLSDNLINEVKILLNSAVKKRLLSDRKIGCLLSGGVDSSLIAALVAQHYPKGELETFSIGIKGAVDLKYAQMVADHIGSKHHSIELTEQEMLNAIPEVIQKIESMDTTTVRASVPNYLISKYIKENTECRVIFQGDGMDEVAGSYLYLANAPSDKDFHNECINLLEEIHRFDVLRADRTISDHGLEPRTPFLDKTFVNYYMSLPVELRMHNDKIEKYVLRKAFQNDNILPEEVLWRRKEAFSDGCSGKQKSWGKIIQDHVDDILTDNEFNELSNNYNHNKPLLKESLYYRIIFDKFYKNYSNVIPHFWMPKWTKGNVIDPSARILDDVYNKNYTSKLEKDKIELTL